MRTHRLRVLIMVSGLSIGEPLGGAERFGVELARHLDQKEFEPILCAFWRRKTSSERYWIDHLTQAGIEIFFATDRSREFAPTKYVEGIRQIAAHFKNRRVDVIHSQFQLGSITALLLKRRLHARALVRTAHGSVRWEWSNTPIGYLCRQVFTKWVFPLLFDAEVGVSQSVVASLNRRPAARLSRKKALLIHNAITLDRFTRPIPHDKIAARRQELGISPNDLVVGSVGRLRKEKGYSVLIDSASIVKEHLPNVKFLIVGDGELWEPLHRKANRMGLAETVIFTGARQDVEIMYRLMDLFVLPSLWEGLPTVVLESMACGVPVVATDIPGTRELIQHGQTGWLAQPGDPHSLATTILNALSNPSQRSSVAQTARKNVVPQFSMASIARQYAHLYRTLI